jgi:hypothetical protein
VENRTITAIGREFDISSDPNSIDLSDQTILPGLVDAPTTTGVAPAALAAGYGAFFIYAALLGLIAIGLSLFIASREQTPD